MRLITSINDLVRKILFPAQKDTERYFFPDSKDTSETIHKDTSQKDTFVAESPSSFQTQNV
jgi:hypothetical protein